MNNNVDNQQNEEEVPILSVLGLIITFFIPVILLIVGISFDISAIVSIVGFFMIIASTIKNSKDKFTVKLLVFAVIVYFVIASFYSLLHGFPD